MSLTTLPLELRHLIYSYLLPLPPLGSPALQQHWDSTPRLVSSRIWQTRVPLNLLLICSRIHDEVLRYHESAVGYLYLPLDSYHLSQLATHPRLIPTTSYRQFRDKANDDGTYDATKYVRQKYDFGPSYAVYELANPVINSLRRATIVLPCINREARRTFRVFVLSSHSNIVDRSYATVYFELLSTFLQALANRPREHRITKLTLVTSEIFGIGRDTDNCDREPEQEEAWFKRLIYGAFGLLKGRVDEVKLVLLKWEKYPYGYTAKVLEEVEDPDEAEKTSSMIEQSIVCLAEQFGIHRNKVSWQWETSEAFRWVGV